MGLKDLYFALEEKYYKFLDWLDGKGIPIYKLVDPVDKVVPSFVLVLIIIGILLVGIVYAIALSVGVFPGTHDIVVTFKDKSGENVPNLEVNIQLEESSIKDTTNAAGAIIFEAKPGKTVTFSGAFNNNEFSKELAVTKDISYTVDLPFNTKFNTVSFTLAPADGAFLSGPVNIAFSCTNPAVQAPQDLYNYPNSQIDVEVDPDCGDLLVSVYGNEDYEEINSQYVQNGDVIGLQGTNRGGSCTLVVNVVDSGNLPLNGVDLTFSFGEYNTYFMNVTGVTNGLYTLPGLAPDKWTVVANKQGYVAEPASVTFNRDGETQSVTIRMNVSGEGTGYVAVSTKDKSTAEPVIGVKVCGWEQKDDGTQGNSLGCTESDAEGLAKLSVPDTTKKFWINAVRTGYKGVTLKDLEANKPPADAYMEVLRDSDRCLIVKVVDSQDLPVANARVYLYDKETNLLGFEPQLTDENGLTLKCAPLIDGFNGVDDGFYKVYAYKYMYNVMSETFEYRSDMPVDVFNVKVTLALPSASLRIRIKDSFGNSVPNAIVRLYDAYGVAAEFVGAKHSDTLGEFVATGIRADKKIYYTIEKEKYERYVSLTRFLTPDVENVDDVVVDNLAIDRKARITVVGAYTEDGQIVNKVAPGELYKLRFKVLMPEDEKEYKQAFVTVVAGTEDIVEKEPFYLERVERSGIASVSKGRIYISDNEVATENDEEATREGNRTVTSEATEGLAFEDEAKWVQLNWDLDDMNVDSGVMYLDVYFRVRETALENTQFTFQYDLATEKGREEFYYPGVGEQEESNDAMGNVTNTKLEYYVFSGKGQQICDDKFCIEATMLDIDEELISDMLGDVAYVAGVGKVYNFRFGLMNTNKKPLTNYRIVIDNPQETLYFNNLNIRSVANMNTDFDFANTSNELENNYEYVYRGQEPLETNNVIRGLINLSPKKLGNASIRFTVIEDNREVYKKEFYVNVTANKDMNVTVKPSLLPSYTYLIMNIEAQDSETGEGIEGASVYIKDVADNVLVADEKTDREGKLEVRLPSQKPNMKLFLTVYKDEYRPFESVYKTTGQFLTIDPQELQMTIKIPEEWGESKLVVKNTSEMPVVITQIALSGDFDEFIDVGEVNTALESAYLSKKIVSDHDFVMPVKIRVTEFAETLQNTMQYTGTLKFVVERENANTGKWYYSVPVTIDLTLGDGLDDKECLGLDIESGKLVSTDSKQVHDVLTVTNGCLVNGKPVTLHNLEAKLEWKGNSLGTLALGKDDRETTVQSAYYRSLAATFAPEAEDTYTVNLVPKNGKITGKGTIDLMIRASIMTSSGLQFVENKVSFDVDVLRLHDCFSFELPEAESDLIKVPRNADNTFKMKNLCEEDVEVRMDVLPVDFIEVSPVTTMVRAGQEQIYKVKSKDSPAGVYLLEVRARTSGHTFEAIRAGTEAFRVFLTPLPTDCITMDNYEYDLYDTAYTQGSNGDTTDINAMRFGYIINKCYKVRLNASYPIKIYSSGLTRADLAKALIPGVATGAAAMGGSYAADSKGAGFFRVPTKGTPAEQASAAAEAGTSGSG